MLGRPFGVPNDAGFQERVLVAALMLLQAPSGPVLADYSENVPERPPDDTVMAACPVAFGPEASAGDLDAALLREVEALIPWHDLARERRGRSTVGLSGVEITKAAELLAGFVTGAPVAAFPSLSIGQTLKLICEDVRAFYYEAAAARPGALNATAIQNWFWSDTAAGRVFLALHERCLDSSDRSLQQLCKTSLVPRSVLIERGKN